MLFGICTLVMDVFKIGYYSSFFECQSAIKILHPLIQAVFVIVQVGGRSVPGCGGKEPMLGKGQESWVPTTPDFHPEQLNKWNRTVAGIMSPGIWMCCVMR